MAFLGFSFNRNTAKPQVQPTTNSFASLAFSTPFMKIGSNNLSMPHINKYYTANNIVMFGDDNLYPQLLNQLYYTSSIHGSIVEFITNAVIGGEYSWKLEATNGVDKVNLLTFESKIKMAKTLRMITRDYIIHKRVCIVINKNDKGELVKIKRLDPSTIRNSACLTKFIYSSDWSKGMVEMKEYKRYDESINQRESIYIYQDETPGQDIYPIPSYNSILNLSFLDGEIAFFHKSNIKNGVFPSLAIRRPKDFSSIEDIDMFKKGISESNGAENAGRLLVLTGNGFDDTPEVVQINPNQNDKTFEQMSKDIKDNIAIAFGVNPSIMGVKTQGSLGNAQELEMSYAIFEKNVVKPTRNVIEEIINDIIYIAKIGNGVRINDFQIIEKTVQSADKNNPIQ